MGLKQTIAPTARLLDPEELRQQVSLLVADHDDYLDQLLLAATAAAEKYTGRALLTQTWRLTLDRFPCGEIRLPRPPVQSVTSITYTDENGDGQTLDSSLYVVAADSQPARIAPAYGEVWPATYLQPEVVTVTFVAGYGNAASDAPLEARHAVRLMVADWFRNREANAAIALQPVPMSAKWLLDGLKTGVQPGWYELAN